LTESTGAKKESEGKSRKAQLQVCLPNSHASVGEPPESGNDRAGKGRSAIAVINENKGILTPVV
jgi:hypothetical protein